MSASERALPSTVPCDSTSTSRRHGRLPSLGRRGEGWVVLQVVLVVAIAATGLVGEPWPTSARLPLALAAGLLALGGASLLVAGIANLGRQLTPFPKPVAAGEVRRSGAYRLVRHPMYGGVLLATAAWALITSPLALLPWVLAAAFLDAKRRREEAWLVERHADYACYMQQVKRRFVPGVW